MANPAQLALLYPNATLLNLMKIWKHQHQHIRVRLRCEDSCIVYQFFVCFMFNLLIFLHICVQMSLLQNHHYLLQQRKYARMILLLQLTEERCSICQCCAYKKCITRSSAIQWDICFCFIFSENSGPSFETVRRKLSFKRIETTNQAVLETSSMCQDGLGNS